MKLSLVFAVVAGAAFLLSTQLFTLFVIQPIGAIPDGVTLLISRGSKMQFIDSPDALCAREMNGVSLMCRAIAAGAVGKNAAIYARLPYSSLLYSVSTGGKSYDR